MVALALERVAVWLDDLAPEGGAFAHALEWAERLRLPLKAFAPAAGQSGLSGSDGGSPAERLEACEQTCLKRGITWEAFRWQGPPRVGAERFLRPGELSVLGSALADPVRQELLGRALHGSRSPVVVCSPSWRPVVRLLVVNQQADAGSCFLDAAARVCLAFRVAPVVLTLGRSEREAQQLQQQAEERLATHRLPADFDCMVGCDGPSAVAVVARWRRCAHVVVERPRTTSWWRGWLRGSLLEQLPRLSGSLTVVALPGEGLPAATPEPERAVPALRWAWGLG